MSEGRSRFYMVGIATMVAGLLALGAAALSVLFTGVPAFPVKVFGRVEGLAQRVARGDVLRLPGAPGVRVGSLGDPSRLRYAAGLTPWLTGGGPAPPERVRLLDQARAWTGAKQYDRALQAYDLLLQGSPDAVDLQVERARVLSWAGRPREAGRALLDVLQREDAPPALRLEAAQYLWWAGEAGAADSLLSAAAASGDARPATTKLQAEIRRTMRPDVRTAERWVREGGGASERLALARALVEDRSFAAALPHFRRVLESGGVADSVYLELAGAAAAADSVQVMVGALTRYLRLHPGDRQVRLTLARAHGWSQDFPRAIALYEELLAAEEDPTLRFEVAQLRAWSGDQATAARDLRRVAVDQPTFAPAFKLLADLAAWRGDWGLAVQQYEHATALDPTMEGVSAGLLEARRQLQLARLAAVPLELGQCAVRVDSYTDNVGFRWASARASRLWRSGWGTVEVVARQDVASAGPLFSDGATTGFGATAEVRAPLGRGVVVSALAGLSSYSATPVLGSWGASVVLTDVGGAVVTARYAHDPALRRAATAAALQAGTTTDVLTVSASRAVRGTEVWAQLEAERFSSDLGATGRYGAVASVSRSLTSRVSVGASMSALTSTGQSPVLPAGGALYWTPELYLAPSVSLSYRMPVGERWRVGGTVSPGYAWVREGSGALRRFDATQMATLGLGVDVSYRSGPWSVLGNAGWSGPLGARGYRATTLQLQGSYQLGRP